MPRQAMDYAVNVSMAAELYSTWDAKAMDIAEFLTVRLDEDEQAAHLASAMNGSTGGKLYSSADLWRAMPGGPFDIFVGVEGEEWPTRPVATAYGAHVAVHIVNHDPARVLAEIEAKRRIIVRYAYRRSIQPEDGIDANRWDDLTRHYWEVCRDLAAPYADHPDFDPSWRVTHHRLTSEHSYE